VIKPPMARKPALSAPDLMIHLPKAVKLIPRGCGILGQVCAVALFGSSSGKDREWGCGSHETLGDQ